MVTERAHIVDCWLSFSGPKVGIVTRGTSYKFALLNQSIIKASWEIRHNSFLKNPTLTKLVRLERELRGIPEDEILDTGDPKLNKYNIFNIKLLEGKKKHAFKDHSSKDHTSTVKVKSPTTRYV